MERKVEKDDYKPQENKVVPRIPNSQSPTPQSKTSPQTQKWIMPCDGAIVGQYGEPRSTHVHNGIDIAVPVGTPIKAIADGTVVVTGPVSGYGYWVGINHGIVNGVNVSSEYGHISKWVGNNGQLVKQGQILAYSGNAKSHKVSIEEVIADSKRNQVANRLGRERGRKYPYCDCSILMHDLLPDYKK